MLTQETLVSRRLEENLEWLKDELGVGQNFDILFRELEIGNRQAALFAVDGLIKDDVLERVTTFLMHRRQHEMTPREVETFIREKVTYIEVAKAKSLEQAVDMLLAGTAILVVDGLDEIILIDTRQYPARLPEPPQLERVTRGPQDGFVETLVMNTALIRRRVRDHTLRTEMHTIGRRSRTDVAMLYVGDIANPELVAIVRKKLQQIEIDGLPMAEKSLAELLAGPKRWWNPFPSVRFTERPDVAAVHLLEGYIVLVVDTTPVVVIMPTTFFDHMEHPEEYHLDSTAGTVLRFVRYVGLFVATLLEPLYLYFTMHPEVLPASLRFIGPNKPAELSFFTQLVLAELGVEMIRMGLIHTPDNLSSSLGIIGAVLLGDLAVQAGIFNGEAVILASTVAIATFLIPYFELSQTVRVWRYAMLLATGFFGLFGLTAAFVAGVVLAIGNKSFGVPYLWPLVPFHGPAMGRHLVRMPIPSRTERPGMLRTKDPHVPTNAAVDVKDEQDRDR